MAKVIKFPDDEAKRRKFINQLFEPFDNEFPTEEMRDCVRSRAIPILDHLLIVEIEKWSKLSFGFPETISAEYRKVIIGRFAAVYGEFFRQFALECFAEIIILQIEVCKLL